MINPKSQVPGFMSNHQVTGFRFTPATARIPSSKSVERILQVTSLRHLNSARKSRAPGCSRLASAT